MSFDFISNLILVVCVAGILVMFLRRAPEVIEEKGQLKLGAIPADPTERRRGALSAVGAGFAGIFSKIGKRIWHFMLEAKDLKQGQILASKLSRIVPSSKKVINIGVHSTLKKAERCFKEGDYAQSEEILIGLLRKYPHEYAAYELLIRIYLKQKNYDDIYEILRYLIKHNPGNERYLAQMGDMLMIKHRYREAIASYEQSVAINDIVPERFVNLGLCYEVVGELARARKNFKKALDLDPANVQYLMMLVDILLKLGERGEAQRELEAAANMNPDSQMVREKLISLQA